MRVTISKWGNSLGVRIPRSVAEDAGIGDGSIVDVRFEDGRLIAVPVPDDVTLESLLAEVTPDNLHDEQFVGRPRGREAW
ncbi:MAG: AbrB/MazE/SpoVT family DNA-binding domain-containing protein [Gemmatimonadaceae bacterium]